MNGPLKDLPFFNMSVVDMVLLQHGVAGRDSSSLIWRILMLSEWLTLYGGAVTL